jgi:hypothetical protein
MCAIDVQECQLQALPRLGHLPVPVRSDANYIFPVSSGLTGRFLLWNTEQAADDSRDSIISATSGLPSSLV